MYNRIVFQYSKLESDKMSLNEQATTNQSTDKLLRILEFLATQTEPVALNVISKSLNMNKSTVLRFLTTLVNNHYLAQEKSTAKYYLTYKICSLGSQVEANNKLSSMVEPYLREISRTVGETACFAINQNDQLVYINVVEAPGKTVRAMQRVGHTAPMHSSGIGKLFLTQYSLEQLENLIAIHGLSKFTEYTFTNKDSLLLELDEIKNNGYAIDNEEWEIGTRCIALPVYDYSNSIKFGLSITGPSARLTDEFMKHWKPYLRGEVAKISNLLGYQA